MADDSPASTLSLYNILMRFKWRIILTWSLVLIEAGLFLMFPLGIGFAVDELLADSYRGIGVLGGLGALLLTMGAARRFYDTRIYAGIYAQIAPELVQRERDRDSEVSVTSARATLASEFVDFMEDVFPEIINSAFALLGTLAILFVLNTSLFYACLACTFLIALVFGATSKTMYGLNSGYNHELENQVKVITDENDDQVTSYFRRLTRWSIRLSDLETANFSLSWVFLMGLMVFSIFAIVGSGATTQGMVFAVLMYVFNYIEAVVALPLFYQQLVRLQEITHRLSGTDPATEEG